MQQIEKSKWNSEARENYVKPDGNIQVNENSLYKVENYIHGKESRVAKVQREKEMEVLMEREVNCVCDSKGNTPNRRGSVQKNSHNNSSKVTK